MITAVLKMETFLAPGVAAKETRRMLKETWHDVGVLWHREMRPKHFQLRHAREYGYVTRQGERGATGTTAFRRSYTGRKEREKGHRNPLKWTGESEQNARIRDVRATSKGVRVVMHTRKLNLRHPEGRIRMNDELRTVSARELRTIVAFMERTLVKRMRDAQRGGRNRRTTR